MRIFGDFSGKDRRVVRQTAFAIIVDGQGRIAVDEVRIGSRVFRDLPGGGRDYFYCPKMRQWRLEEEEEALPREVGEEIGMLVKLGARLGEAIQGYRSSDGRTNVLSYSGLWTAERVGQTPPTEDNHRLVWMDPVTAISQLRHDSHRWFVVEWLIWEQRDQSYFPRVA